MRQRLWPFLILLVILIVVVDFFFEVKSLNEVSGLSQKKILKLLTIWEQV